MPISLGTMRAIALDMADVTGDAHISVPMVNHWFNLELAALNDLYIASEENYFCQKTTIPLVNRQRTYPVPDNLYRITKLWFLDQSGVRLPMRRVTLDDIDSDLFFGGWGLNGQGAPRYEFIDRNIELSTGTASGSLVLWYVPTFASLTDDSQTIQRQIPTGHADWVMLGVAIRCRIKEESDPSALLAKRQEVENRIVTLMSQRDQGEAQSVRDVVPRQHGNMYQYSTRGRR